MLVAKFRFAQWLWDWLFRQADFSFEWDRGNTAKSNGKHGVTRTEAEQVFTANHLVPLGEQYQPPAPELRYGVLGETRKGKLLFLAFTLRGRRIRVISARPMSARERRLYVSLRKG
jgi:uncharacterized protein